MLDLIPHHILLSTLSYLFSMDDPDPNGPAADPLSFRIRHTIPGRTCYPMAGVSKRFHGIVHSQEFWSAMLDCHGLTHDASLFRSYCAFFPPHLFDPAISIRFCRRWASCRMTFLSTVETVTVLPEVSLDTLKNTGLDLVFQINQKLCFAGHVRVLLHGQNEFQLQGFVERAPAEASPDDMQLFAACKEQLCSSSCCILSIFMTGAAVVYVNVKKNIFRRMPRTVFKGRILHAANVNLLYA